MKNPEEIIETDFSRMFKEGRWKPNTNVKDEEIWCVFFDTYVSLGEIIERLILESKKDTLDSHTMRRESRLISCLLRKLIFDKANKTLYLSSLMKNLFLHPLKKVKKEQNSEIIRISKGIPSFFKCIDFHNLIGYEIPDKKISLSIFDFDAKESDCKSWESWKNQLILTADQPNKALGGLHSFSIEKVLEYVANKEGAHADIRDHHIRYEILKTIGGYSSIRYPHVITLCVSFYLHFMITLSMCFHREEWANVGITLNPPTNNKIAFYEFTARLDGIPSFPMEGYTEKEIELVVRPPEI